MVGFESVFFADYEHDESYHQMNHSTSGIESAIIGRSSASSDLHAFASAQLKTSSRKGI